MHNFTSVWTGKKIKLEKNKNNSAYTPLPSPKPCSRLCCIVVFLLFYFFPLFFFYFWNYLKLLPFLCVAMFYCGIFFPHFFCPFPVDIFGCLFLFCCFSCFLLFGDIYKDLKRLCFVFLVFCSNISQPVKFAFGSECMF